MKLETAVLLSVFVLFTIGCKEDMKRPVTIAEYNLRHERLHEQKAEVGITSNGKVKEYIYADSNDSDTLTSHVVKQYSNSDSLLLYYQDTARLIGSKNYSVDGKSWEIKKYFGNNGGIADGEYLIYMNPELGMVAIQSQAWGNYSLFDYENDKISQFLIKDSLTFFNRFQDIPKAGSRE